MGPETKERGDWSNLIITGNKCGGILSGNCLEQVRRMKLGDNTTRGSEKNG